MYIKQINIQGFKSYKDQTSIEEFSPKHNVIVGRNGSGKSNFFAAIRFVLSDQYTQLSREDRHALLHEGTGSAVMSAYVEVIFDNSDDRLPTGTEEVILRRTIGQKKDEYSLNRKNTTKQEVMGMFDTAGFSRSNPYYIVPQGRVTAITNMRDYERLNMLKEVAGTNVYEERRRESRKIMDETAHKREKADELLDHIRGRLGELEEEKEELRAFQDKDRERRCLEYTIHRKDQEALQEAQDNLNEAREGGVERTDEQREALQQNEIQLEEVEAEIFGLRQQLELFGEEKTQLEDERKDSSREKARIELDVQSMIDNQTAAQQSQRQHEQELRNVQQQIQDREAEFAEIIPQYNAKREEERTFRQQLQSTQAAITRLLAKQGRQSQFKSKKERDAYLNKEIDTTNNAISTRKATLMQTNEEIQELETQIDQVETDIATLRGRIENRGDEQQNISADIQRAKDEENKLHDRRREIWREEAKLETVIGNAKDQLEKAQRFLNQMMDQNQSRGLANVRRIVREHNIEGAYGPLGSLFDFSDKYKTAIEVTAGASLFHYVVDTEETATKILNILAKEKGGRVTFVPLNRIQPKTVNLPKASDAVHLISKLKFDKKYQKAFEQVFGKTILCPNLQVAAQYARSHGVNAITPEGDRSDKKGALTGGFHDVRNSRCDGMKREAKALEEYESNVARRNEIKAEEDAIGQQITKAMSDRQKIEQRRAQMEGGYGPQRDELRRRENELNMRRDELDVKLRAKDNIESVARQMGEQLDDYNKEKSSDFKKALSDQEEQQLESLSAELPKMRKQLSELAQERAELESRKSNLDDELRSDLRLRLDQLQAADADAGAESSAGAGGARLKERQKDLKRKSAALESINQKLAENEEAMEQAQQQLQELTKDRSDKQAEVESLRTKIKNHQKNVEKAAAKRQLISNQLAEVATQIRNLGVLPDAAFTGTYANMDAKTATSRLHKVQDALKKYGHVNKKAFEQYTQFEKQREVLEQRRAELDSSDVSIRELIDHLDRQKDEAIERTFRQVSREFASIFERLVPAGKGRLVIQRRSDRQAREAAEEDDSEDERERGGGVENYTGIGISVSFNSKADEQQRIQQLSGGQKSLCALALVFAIQASDPAPFYLFDEIDANLDAQYRTAVAELLKESSRTGGQFICTTFRPEMLLVAEKCYGVSYLKKASKIDVVSREQALDFIEGQISGK